MTHAVMARVSLVDRAVSLRIAKISAMFYSPDLHSRIGIELDVSPPVFLAAFGCSVAVNGMIGTVAGRAQPGCRETVFFHQVLFNGVGTLVRKLNVIGASARGIGVAFNVHDGVLVGLHLAANLIHHGAGIQAHTRRVRIKVDGAMLGCQRCGSFGRRVVLDGRFTGRGGETAAAQLLDVTAVYAVFRVADALDHAQLAIHVLGHAEYIGVIGVRSLRSQEGSIVGVIGQLHASEHGLGQVGGNVEILHRPDQVVGALGMVLDELYAFQPALGELEQGLGMLGGKSIADHENVGDQAVGNPGVIDFLGAGALAYSVAHVGIPGYSGVDFVLRKENRRLDAVLGVHRLVKDFLALVCAEAGSFEAIP